MIIYLVEHNFPNILNNGDLGAIYNVFRRVITACLGGHGHKEEPSF